METRGRRRKMTPEERQKALDAMKEWREAIHAMALILLGDGMSVDELEAALEEDE